MKKRIFTGAATALITPMKADGSVNFDRLETLVDEQVKGGMCVNQSFAIPIMF